MNKYKMIWENKKQNKCNPGINDWEISECEKKGRCQSSGTVYYEYQNPDKILMHHLYFNKGIEHDYLIAVYKKV